MDETTRIEEKNKRKGFLVSIVFHTLVIVLAALYGFKYQSPPPEPGGISVNLGVPDVGQGDENASATKPADPVKEPEEVTPPPPPKQEVKPEPVTKQPKAEPKKEVVKTEDPEAIALKKQKEEEKRKADAEAKAKAEATAKAKAEADAKAKAEADAKAKAEADAKAKAEAERKAEEAKRKALEDMVIGGVTGSGSGKGNTGKAGNQGDPSGDPNSDNLKGVGAGSGAVGGNLSGRGVLKKGPAILDKSQEDGVIFLDVCVDKTGKVISAEYTQKGSTTNNSKLVALAKQNALAWQFSAGTLDKQCGTIRYDFKLK